MKIHLAAFVASPVLALSFGIAHASFDMLLKVPGIAGESPVSGHSGETRVLSMNWGALGEMGRPTLQQLQRANTPCINRMTLTKPLDSTTADFMTAVLAGTLYSSVQLTVRQVAGSTTDLFVITMTNVKVATSTLNSTEGPDAPTEAITLQFQNAKGVYRYQNLQGQSLFKNFDTGTAGTCPL